MKCVLYIVMIGVVLLGCGVGHAAKRPEKLKKIASTNSVESLRDAIEDLSASYGPKYPKAAEYLKKLDEIEKRPAGDEKADADLAALANEALLANPLLDFDRLLLVQRGQDNLGLPQNWQGNCAIAKRGYDNQIAILSPVKPGGKLTTLYKPTKGEFVGDVDLHFDADRMLFSMPGNNGQWQIFEMKADGSGLRQLTPDEPGIDNYDPCYRPDGKILFASTRAVAGVPCVGGGNTVANLCVMDADGKNLRQICFDQEHNWCPTILNDGRVLYSRWEYSDTPHYFTRLLFHMNPDGTGQMEHYGSNSYWPNSIFYARPVPNHPTKLVAVISGHHGVARMGELVVFDPAMGRHEAEGAVQKIPGHERPVDPIIQDGLVQGSWPKFLHPYPLSDKYILVSAQPKPEVPWGIYLVDVFDNMTLICQTPGAALLEPLPLRKTVTPPVIPDKVKLDRRDAVVYIADIYSGPGLAGVPRGTVKKLRIYEPHYAYPHMGGHIDIGIDGPWDVRRIHGTVPVEEDGSAAFIVPANTPLVVQPLDGEGKSLQVMRSWFTAMPGETVSCVGCHDKQNNSPPAHRTIASTEKPSAIQPWNGPVRGFAFKREVQPVLDQYCVGCHDDAANKANPAVPSFVLNAKPAWRSFDSSYVALHPFVRRPGPESDYHLQVPLEWGTNTSELVQMLRKGHHNVKLDAQAWDRLITWIDLNVPDHGTWSEYRKIAQNFHDLRLEMRTKYANNPVDPEAVVEAPVAPVAFIKPEPEALRTDANMKADGWPFDAAEAKRRQESAGASAKLKLDMAAGLSIEMALIPTGQFVMGDVKGAIDESPRTAVKIDRPFYMGMMEITNEQYALFDAGHDSGFISVTNKDQNTRGEAVNHPRQPVVRVSWQQAVKYCQWLSEKTGRKFSLPTEAQWEYACRAGTATPMWFGETNTDFSKFANLADARVNDITKRDSPRWIPSIASIDDGAIVTEHGDRYQPNPWGLRNMHGNAAEWTASLYRPYPYREDDGRNKATGDGERVARGGSFYDRPYRATAGFRLAYPTWQRVYNVGFRVICDVPATTASAEELKK